MHQRGVATPMISANKPYHHHHHHHIYIYIYIYIQYSMLTYLESILHLNEFRINILIYL